MEDLEKPWAVGSGADAELVSEKMWVLRSNYVLTVMMMTTVIVVAVVAKSQNLWLIGCLED